MAYEKKTSYKKWSGKGSNRESLTDEINEEMKEFGEWEQFNG